MGTNQGFIRLQKSKHLVTLQICLDSSHKCTYLCGASLHLGLGENGPSCQQTSLSKFVAQPFAISCCLLASPPGVQRPFKLCPDNLHCQYGDHSFPLTEFAEPEPSGPLTLRCCVVLLSGRCWFLLICCSNGSLIFCCDLPPT